MKEGSVSDLSRLLQNKKEVDRKILEDLTEREFKSFAENLSRLSNDALNTIVNDIESHKKSLFSSLLAIKKEQDKFLNENMAWTLERGRRKAFVSGILTGGVLVLIITEYLLWWKH